jgi:hypothetical protein
MTKLVLIPRFVSGNDQAQLLLAEGGQSHCKLTNNQLTKVRSKASKFSFDNDAAFYTKREKGDMPAEIFRCDVPSAVIGRISTISFCCHW